MNATSCGLAPAPCPLPQGEGEYSSTAPPYPDAYWVSATAGSAFRRSRWPEAECVVEAGAGRPNSHQVGAPGDDPPAQRQHHHKARRPGDTQAGTGARQGCRMARQPLHRGERRRARGNSRRAGGRRCLAWCGGGLVGGFGRGRRRCRDGHPLLLAPRATHESAGGEQVVPHLIGGGANRADDAHACRMPQLRRARCRKPLPPGGRGPSAALRPPRPSASARRVPRRTAASCRRPSGTPAPA